MTQPTDRLYRQLIEAGLEADGPSEDLRRRVLAAAAAAPPDRSHGDTTTALPGSPQPSVRLVPDVPTERADGVQRETHPIEEPPSRRHMPRRFVAMLKQGKVRWAAAAAVVALVVLGGFSFRGRGAKPGTQPDQWWAGPASAWAAEINAAIATIRGVTCRERWEVVNADGSPVPGSTWMRFYVSYDSYRRDIYDGDFFREIQWYTPDGHDMLQTSVRFDTRSYCVLRHKGSFGQEDPVQRIRFYAGLLDKTDRQLGTSVIDGHECIGFEIRASLYSDNPNTWVDRIWFDVKTRLPVRMEQAGLPVTGDATKTFTKVQDQFDYNPVLPEDTFTPSIPEGFINAHPDELNNQR